MPTIDVIIPALDEEQALPLVLAEIPAGVFRRTIVVDNGSTDGTARVARLAGAEVVFEPERGYGAACLCGVERLREDPPDIVVFLDADHSDRPQEVTEVLRPILEANADLVIGSRSLGRREARSLSLQQRVGNAIACMALAMLYGARFTDLGPFRAVRWGALERLQMKDRNWGWTIEMQIKAAKSGLVCAEVPVSYRRRIGRSKISGTLRGSVAAGTKILWMLARHAR